MKILVCLLPILFLLACNGEPATDHESALPHTETTGGKSALTDAEKEALQSADGKTATIVSQAQLKSMIDQATGKLHVFNFYQLGCGDCLAINSQLEQVREQWSDRDLQLVQISLDGEVNKKVIDVYLRQNGLTGKTYLSNTAVLQRIEELDWDGQLPLTVAINRGEDVFVKYQQKFEEGALAPLLEALVF